MNTRTLLGVLLAAFAAFLWGFAFWGASSLSYSGWSATQDDAEAQAVLEELFPATGYYTVPNHTQHSPEVFNGLLADGGVWATVNMDHSPPQQGDPTTLLLGFGHNLVVMFLLALLLLHAEPNRVRMALLAGLMAAVFSNIGDVVWWNYPVTWKLTIFLYDMGFWLIGGLILGYFMRGQDGAQPAATA